MKITCVITDDKYIKKKIKDKVSRNVVIYKIIGITSRKKRGVQYINVYENKYIEVPFDGENIAFCDFNTVEKLRRLYPQAEIEIVTDEEHLSRRRKTIRSIRKIKEYINEIG